ncbi:kinase-like domain-containing protein [Gigaspora rosea]|uniref:Kinase-like domain-containing protein n=1 Tax=Gigaspora rosea TaxID=44941 RepID=A0A397VCD7_9GLOM|nr:kinase-like domain-containing protein [Gigaspora rosea]
MVLQFANGGNLREYLGLNFLRLRWIDKLHIAKEIVLGLIFLHKNNIVHRDLHSKNILIHEGRPKIADFGLSKQTTEASKTSNSAGLGMLAYIDPKCFDTDTNGYKRNKKSDIYSFGVILWEISSGRPPFQSFNQMMMIGVISKEKKEEPIKGTPPQYVALYKQCWNADPANRPESNSILKTLNQLIADDVDFKLHPGFTVK